MGQCRLKTRRGKGILEDRWLWGGTGVLGAGCCWVRPAPGGIEACVGRLTVSTADFNGDIAFGSSDGMVRRWPCGSDGVLAGHRKLLSYPRAAFVLGGDWQCPLDMLEQSGLPKLLGATAFVPVEGTNTSSGRTVDYFSSWNCFLTSDWSVRD